MYAVPPTCQDGVKELPSEVEDTELDGATVPAYDLIDLCIAPSSLPSRGLSLVRGVQSLHPLRC